MQLISQYSHNCPYPVVVKIPLKLLIQTVNQKIKQFVNSDISHPSRNKKIIDNFLSYQQNSHNCPVPRVFLIANSIFSSVVRKNKLVVNAWKHHMHYNRGWCGGTSLTASVIGRHS